MLRRQFKLMFEIREVYKKCDFYSYDGCSTFVDVCERHFKVSKSIGYAYNSIMEVCYETGALTREEIEAQDCTVLRDLSAKLKALKLVKSQKSQKILVEVVREHFGLNPLGQL